MRKLTIIFFLLAFVAGCGQKGPLYHPEPQQEKTEKDVKKQEEGK
ncbi:MAG: lipoprotein [Gammaproteobacteria bacterium]|nr:lipoprotein [Gammaproteobacteria bacterium]